MMSSFLTPGQSLFLRRLAMGLVALALPGAVVGPALTYIPLVLAILILAALEPKESWSALGKTWLHSPVATLVAAFLVVLVGSSLGGIAPAYSLAQTRMVALLAVCGGVLCHLLGRQPQAVLVTFWKALAAFTLAGFGFTFLIAGGEPWFLQWGLYEPQDMWTQTHLRFFSSVLAVTLPFCWVWWLNTGKTLRMDGRGLWLCGLSGVVVIVSAGRAGWLGMGASLAAFLLLMVRHHKVALAWGKLALTGVVSLAAGGFAYTLFYGLASVEERIGVVVPDRGLGGGRLDIWKTALAHMGDQPVFGIGTNAFRFLPGADYHPHNVVLQLGLETGILGSLIAVALVGLVSWDLLKRSRTDVMASVALSSLVGFEVCALTNKSIFNPAWLVFLVVILALGRQTTRLTLKNLIK